MMYIHALHGNQEELDSKKIDAKGAIEWFVFLAEDYIIK